MPRDPFATPAGVLLGELCGAPLFMPDHAALALLGRVRAAIGAGLLFDFEDAPTQRRLTVQDGTAIIPIRGAIIPRGTAFSALLGMASVEGLRALFREAQAREDVRAILFDVDSFGGRVDGLADLAAEFMRARGGKPMVSSINDNGYSAAYFLASAADQVFVTQSGGLGSIGAFAVHVSEARWLEREGLDVTIVKSGAEKALLDPSKPLSDRGLEKLQELVDFHAGQFIDFVAGARGLDAQTVRGFEAGTFDGKAGVTAGLADRVGTLDDALARATRLAGGRSASRGGGTRAMATDETTGAGGAGTGEGAAVVDLEAVRVEREEREARAREAGKAEATREHQARVAAIGDLCVLNGTPEKAAGLIASDKTVDAIRAELAAERRATAAPTSSAHGTEGRDEETRRVPLEEVYAQRNATKVAARGIGRV